MISKEDFNKIWKDSTKEGILNQYYYDYIELIKVYSIIKEIREMLEHKVEFHKNLDFYKDKELETQVYYNYVACLQDFDEIVEKYKVEFVCKKEEDKKIEKLKLNDSDVWTGKTDTNLIVEKINEIVDYINKEEK